MKIKAEHLETLDAETADLNHFIRNAADADVQPAEVFERIATVIESLRVIAISVLPEENRSNWLAYDGATLTTAANDARDRSNALYEEEDPGEDPGGYDESTNPSNGWRAPEVEIDGQMTASCSGCDETVLAGTLTTTTGLCEECDDEMDGTGAGQ